jgi:hypothetical protein
LYFILQAQAFLGLKNIQNKLGYKWAGALPLQKNEKVGLWVLLSKKPEPDLWARPLG